MYIRSNKHVSTQKVLTIVHINRESHWNLNNVNCLVATNALWSIKSLPESSPARKLSNFEIERRTKEDIYSSKTFDDITPDVSLVEFCGCKLSFSGDSLQYSQWRIFPSYNIPIDSCISHAHSRTQTSMHDDLTILKVLCWALLTRRNQQP